MMMMPQPNYIYTQLAIWPNQSKIKQQTTSIIYHAIAIYVPATNMPHISHIYSTYANEFMYRYKTTMSVHISHTDSLLEKYTCHIVF